ncbi:hypothetical protein BDB00DRAFT_568999 [Zychaea mexicana]|uniref:uncharacterized protein n=1 Tax=Zychaea mexicana TaxID=64656 RepID=UPI0022FE1A65|nr:uncharacterized protein BDB00DRAFT_568999 [Zychaea mexicana]KAI9490077.1 hypothetical protein BDB00DRAFT_568999 [Zychaea mexicana]
MLQIPVKELPREATVDTWLSLLDRKEQIAQKSLLTDLQKQQIHLYGRLKGNSLLLDPNDFFELLETLVGSCEGDESIGDLEQPQQYQQRQYDDDHDDHDEDEDDDHCFSGRRQNGRVMMNGNDPNVAHYDDEDAIETYANGNNHPIDRYQTSEHMNDDGHYEDEDVEGHVDDGVNDEYDNSIDKEELAHQHQQQQQQRQRVYQDLLQPPADSPVSQSMDARSRTSRLLNFTPARFQKMRRVDPADDSDAETGGTRGGSLNHPSVSPVSIVGIHDDHDYRDLTRSGGIQSRFNASPQPHHNLEQHHLRDNTWNLRDMVDVDNIRPMASVSESLHSQHHHSSSNSVAQRRLQETERRLEKISQEYDEQIAKLEVDLSTMRHEIVMHKKTIAEYQTQEHMRLEHISDLETQIEEYGSKHTKIRQTNEQLKNRLEERNEEVARLQEALQTAAGKLKQAEANFEQLYLEYSSHKAAREKTAELQMHLDQEIEGKQSLIMELEEKTRENSRMKHIIDDMKTDLDEARRRAAQIVVPVKTLSDELGESSSVTGQGTKEVQTEQQQQQQVSSGSSVGDKEKLDSLRVVLAKTEQQLETSEEHLELSERRVKELEDKLADVEQNLMRGKRFLF